VDLLNKNNYGLLSAIDCEFPPVDAFWSVTMHSSPEWLLVANPINLCSISDRMKERRL